MALALSGFLFNEPHLVSRLRQVDVKAEHFERQVQRIEAERDNWEKKYEVSSARLGRDRAGWHLLTHPTGLPSKVPRVEGGTRRACQHYAKSLSGLLYFVCCLDIHHSTTYLRCSMRAQFYHLPLICNNHDQSYFIFGRVV